MFNRTSIAILCAALIMPCGLTYAADEEGRVNGGAAAYSIPIEAPIDSQLFRPDVSLSYSSRSGNGRMGMGWSLWSRNSSVHRCPATIAMDGFDQEVNYTSTDRLCIDGQRMLPVRGKYGKDGSAYRTETDYGVLVILHGDVNDADAWFEVYDDDGGKRLYRERSIPEGAPAALYWYETERMNAQGNAIEYAYAPSAAGGKLLETIRYGGNPSAGSGESEEYFIRFEYGDRDDVSTELLSGGEDRQTRFLRRIVSGQIGRHGDEPFNEYRLAYRKSLSTGRLLLVEVVKCSSVKANERCGKPTKIEWLDKAIAFSRPRRIEGPVAPAAGSLAAAWSPGNPRPRLGGFFDSSDFDVDGRTEILERRADGTASVWFMDMDGKSAEAVEIRADRGFFGESPDAYTGRDLRHMGGADLFGRDGDAMSIMSWRGQAFTKPVSIGVPSSNDIVVLDVDNDGRDDLLEGRKTASMYRVFLHRNLIANDRDLRYGDAELVAEMSSDASPRLKIGYGTHGMGRAVVLMDGKKPLRFLMFGSREDGSLNPALVDPIAYGMHPDAMDAEHLFADINGDGMAEIVYASRSGQLMVQLNNGAGFSSPLDTGVEDPRVTGTAVAASLVADYNNDGKDDILFPSRRLVDFCIRSADLRSMCGEELSEKHPDMDFGIYEYDAVSFKLDDEGRYHPERIAGMGVVGQANRLVADNLYGDSAEDYFSPFDRGLENGWFADAKGELTECPSGFKCGLHVVSANFAEGRDRRDTVLDTVSSIAASNGSKFRWRYYPLSSIRKNLYSVPGIESPDRYIGNDRFYFRSSMYVVGEFEARNGGYRSATKYEYGGAAYNSQGRGFTGFQWISVDQGFGQKYTAWFRQEFPYWGILEHEWTEQSSDNENDYVNASPGERFVSKASQRLTCYGPKGSPVTIRFGCALHDAPGFIVNSTPAAQSK